MSDVGRTVSTSLSADSADQRPRGGVIAVIDDDDHQVARVVEAAAELADAWQQPLRLLLLQRRESCPESVGLSLSTPWHYAAPLSRRAVSGLATSCQPIDQAASAWIRAVAELSGAAAVVVADRTAHQPRVARWFRWLAGDLADDLGRVDATFSVVAIQSAR